MVKTYKLITDDPERENEQKTIEVTEIKEVTLITKTTPAQLKGQYQEQVERIAQAEKRANEIVDELVAIDNATELSISNIPKKL